MILDKVPEVKQLTAEEQWGLIEELWRRLLPRPDHEPRAEIVAMLDARMEEFQRDPSCGYAWGEAKARLRAARNS